MTNKELCERLWHLNECAKQLEEETKAIIISMAAQEDEESHENQNGKDSQEKSRDKGKKEIYRPKPIKVLDDPENKHRWKYECPRCKKFTAEKTKYNSIYCGECGHYASTYGWYEKIGFQEVPTDENTKWPEEPKFNLDKHMLPLEGVIEKMREKDEEETK